nr:reverse transcriptase domain-containing protein [Tanacetum cinerariifolium]
MSAGSSRSFASGSGGTSGRQRVIMCYNCKCEGHMAKQYTKPKRKHDAEWFKDKVLLVQAQDNGQFLQEEELDFLADPGTAEPGHYRNECPKLRNQNRKNKTWNKTGYNEAKARALQLEEEEPTLILTSSRIQLLGTKNTCYEYGRPGHYRNECPKLRNQNRKNKTWNKTGYNEAKARALQLEEEEPTLILTSFMSNTFSTLLDVIPSTLDVCYAVELADGRISETDVILRGFGVSVDTACPRHSYVVSSLIDTAYWSLEQ